MHNRHMTQAAETTASHYLAAQFVRAGETIILAGEPVAVKAAYRTESRGCPEVMLDTLTADYAFQTTFLPFGAWVGIA